MPKSERNNVYLLKKKKKDSSFREDLYMTYEFSLLPLTRSIIKRTVYHGPNGHTISKMDLRYRDCQSPSVIET